MDPFDPTQTDPSSAVGPDFWHNLMNFGLATMAAGSQRTAQGLPAYNTLGAIGAGGLQAAQQAQQVASLRSNLGRTQAETGLIGAETQQKRFQNNLSLLQMNQPRYLYGMPPITMDASGNLIDPLQGAGASATSGGTVPPAISGSPQSATQPQKADVPSVPGMTYSASAGHTTMPVGAAPPGLGGVEDQWNSLPASLRGDVPPQGGQGQGSGRAVPAGSAPSASMPGGMAGPTMGSIPQPRMMELVRGATPNGSDEMLALSEWHGIMGDQQGSQFWREQAFNTPAYKGAQAGAVAAAEVGPHVREAGGKAAAELPYHLLGQGWTLQNGPNGPQMVPVPGGMTDPNYMQGAASATGWGKAGPEAWGAAMRPQTLRGPGSVYINPYFAQTVQVPNEINAVDEGDYSIHKKFVPLGLSVTGNGPFGAPTGVPSTPGSMMPQSALAGSGLTPGGATLPSGRAVNQAVAPPGGSAEGEGTSFMTSAPPGALKMVEGAAQNYTEEGRRAYEAAMGLRGSIAFIQRDLDALGPQGFQAMGSGADLRNSFAKAISTAQQMVGMEPTFDPNKIGAWEDFGKESTLGGMKGMASILGQSREAASVIHSAMGAFPHPENSYQGAQLLVSSFMEGANHEIDKRIFETNWANAHGGNLIGANEAFNQQYRPEQYSWRAVSKVQPYVVQTPNQMKRYLPGTYIKTPDGQVRMVPGQESLQLQGAQQ